MSLKHTKSPSGKTHRLTHKTAHPVPVETAVTLRYLQAPQYDDQVQGDLIRKMQREHGLAMGVGILPVTIELDLRDSDQQEPSLDYLRGYLAGLEGGYGQGQQHIRDAIQRTREQIAKLEAEPTLAERYQAMGRRYMETSGMGTGAPTGESAEGRDAGLGDASRPSRMDPTSEAIRRIKDAEARGW